MTQRLCLQVFDAKHKSLQKNFALKLMPVPPGWMLNESNAQGFRRVHFEHEVDFLRNLRHDNIIEFHDQFTAVYKGEDCACIATELADGEKNPSLLSFFK